MRIDLKGKREASELGQIVFSGKGRIGKSATLRNVLAAFVALGQKILIVGWDPKVDPTRPILNCEAQEIHVVMSGEMMAPSAANNIAKALAKMPIRGASAWAA